MPTKLMDCMNLQKTSPSSVGEILSGETGSSKRAKNFLSFFQSNRPTTTKTFKHVERTFIEEHTSNTSNQSEKLKESLHNFAISGNDWSLSLKHIWFLSSPSVHLTTQLSCLCITGLTQASETKPWILQTHLPFHFAFGVTGCSSLWRTQTTKFIQRNKNPNLRLWVSWLWVHIPDDFEFNFSWGELTGFDSILQCHSQCAPATDVEDLVVGLDTALLAGWRAWHHLQTVDALPFAANASRQLYTCTQRENTQKNTVNVLCLQSNDDILVEFSIM